ncbi:DNA repair protein RecO [Paramicrobacterium fandaimingii]|uniref:DNA repair protein RecO n=1 Tax=Paramicrobacterium fandaimingii TaxID=2708079 RepID=UPI00141EF010|nr:DNA repair protein RecO [Microbacterium fandaimingii]
MPIYRDEGVVLRTHKLGEADRIVTLLTRQHGKVRAVAKGIRRTSSRFGSRLEPFMVADLQLYEGRSLDTITQAETLGAYGQIIAADYDSYTAANVMVETADKITESDTNRQQYLLLLGALRSLSRAEHAPAMTLDSYLLRALSLAGWAPSFIDCARCQRPGPHETVVVQMGGVVCVDCAPTGSPKIDVPTRELLGSLLAGEWNIVDAADAAVRTRASGLVAAYVQWHLERGIRSYAHLSSSPSAERRK